MLSKAKVQSSAVSDIGWAVEFKFNKLTVFVDSTNALSFKEVNTPVNASGFKQIQYYQNKDFQSGVLYWIRFLIHHHAQNHDVGVVGFFDQTIDNIDLYVRQIDGQ